MNIIMIVSTIIMSVYCIALAIVIVVLDRRIKKLIKRCKELEEELDYELYRMDPIRFNFLMMLRDSLIKSENYEEVARINEILRLEFDSDTTLKDLL